MKKMLIVLVVILVSLNLCCDEIVEDKADEQQLKEMKFSLFHFGVFITCAALAYDSITEVNEIKHDIHWYKNNESNLDYSKIIEQLEKRKDRKSIVCLVTTAASLISISYIMKPVTIEATPNSINVTYKF
jgi:hypothetical protein